ncbi:hypothetical protein Aph01nite_02710 [Acrocarpospora phusangensis]|uniref:TPM domain-containing protein n=1 Tax=Acrocarpospora phusangensis TaxID=1070424 RepID=A0A919UHV3_9ACTN|nr:hypothetical protein [Acrocarpospora phusangensis]GIH21961.1 hypothetical protein Aph01nite_02710 [Acrocarpospora phusangensis]
MTKTHSPTRLKAAAAALLTGLVALLFSTFLFTPVANAAAAPPDVATAVAAWRSGDPLFVLSGSPLSSEQQSGVREALKGSKSKIYAVALPDGSVTEAEAGQFITRTIAALDKAGRSAATVAVLDGMSLFAGSSAIPSGAPAILANLATQHNGDVVTGMQDFVNRVNLVAGGESRKAQRPESMANPGAGSAAIWYGLLGVAVVGGGGLWFISRRMKRQREAREAAELAAVKRTVEEDVTKFGEEITALDLDARMLPAAGTDHDWQHALDSYEKAKTELAATKRPDELRTVTATLEDGRYALAVVKAKMNQEPVPERLAPCFFNPQHGPSVRNVRWAPPGGALRDVPACAMDAQAIERGFDPQMREVVLPNGQRAPYWNAGPAYQPYASGYYGGFDGGSLLTGMLVGTMLGSAFGGWGMGGYGAGYADGLAADGGGGDWGGGGGDWGGGDFGGGDFGGGDW